jgi:hypothetical protein
MSRAMSAVLRRVLGISTETFRDLVAERYGEHADLDTAWLSFEPVARTLVDGFYLTVDDPRFEVLVPKLDAVDEEMRGIAYEGAGMGLMLLDSLFPWRRRLDAFLAGPGSSYRGLVVIGAGLVMPRIPLHPERFMRRHDPALRWFVMDGYGFYEGFFNAGATIDRQVVSDRLHGYSRRAFDQGLGRCLWFTTGADFGRIIAAISAFPAARQADLWSGIGLACAYAAGVADRDSVGALLEAAGRHRADMAVGTAMASVIRAETRHPAPHTELACDVVWGRDSHAVAEIADLERHDLPVDGAVPSYEVWRRRIRDTWVLQAPAQSMGEGER